MDKPQRSITSFFTAKKPPAGQTAPPSVSKAPTDNVASQSATTSASIPPSSKEQPDLQAKKPDPPTQEAKVTDHGELPEAPVKNLKSKRARKVIVDDEEEEGANLSPVKARATVQKKEIEGEEQEDEHSGAEEEKAVPPPDPAQKPLSFAAASKGQGKDGVANGKRATLKEEPAAKKAKKGAKKEEKEKDKEEKEEKEKQEKKDQKKQDKEEKEDTKQEKKKESPAELKKESKEAAAPEKPKPKNFFEVKPKSGKEEKKDDSKEAKAEPSTPKHPLLAAAGWEARQDVPYVALARVFAQIENTTSRLKIVELLRDFFRQVIALSPSNLLPAIYLSVNKGIELGIGESILMKAVADSTGRTLAVVKSTFHELGDLGLVAQASRHVQRTMFTPKPLTIPGVYKALREIALESGQASQAKKKDRIQVLLVACRESEAQYIIRSLEGKLRIGLAEQSVIVALAHACTYTPPQLGGGAGQVIDASKGVKEAEFTERLTKAVEILKSVYSELPSYDDVIPALLKHGLEDLPKHCFLTPGIPVKPMLAQPTKGISEVLDRFSGIAFTCEYKYDGERAQIHRLEDGTIQVYSRNLENNTAKYPDIIQNLPHALKPDVKTFIIDCEAVAYDKVADKILPFQVLSTRARKGVELENIKVQVVLYAFDLLYLNGQSLVKEPLIVRRERLYNSFQLVPSEFAFATHRDASDVEEIQTFLNEAIAASCEGLMIKTLNQDTIGSSYEPSKRSYKWLKVKKDYLQGMTDSFDLVPVGAFTGKGKRTGVYGAYLLACYDDENDEYQTICKIGTGFSDEMLQKHAEFLNQHIIPAPRSYYRYGETAKPDVWFAPSQVWEVAAADLSISPAYKAAEGLVAQGKGISLRFPRFLRIRDDKTPETATNSQQVADMYKRQQSAQTHSGNAGEDDDY